MVLNLESEEKIIIYSNLIAANELFLVALFANNLNQTLYHDRLFILTKGCRSMKYKHVIWDWNGTLLNDVQLGHRLLNYLQKLKGVKTASFVEYRKMFTFPITEFYKRAGLFKDDKSFYKLADIWIKEYDEGVKECFLHEEAEDVLENLMDKGVTHSILTASLESMALAQLKSYGIDKYFTAVTGKQDYYASGKSELIEKHLKKIEYAPEEIIFVGDTLHDMEIANNIGCDHIIVENGHQDVKDLPDQDITTASNLSEVAAIILAYNCIHS